MTITQDNPFTRGEWVGGTQQVNYGALDNVGVRAVRPVVGGILDGGSLRPCNYALRVPCPNGPGTLAVNTTKLAEGLNRWRCKLGTPRRTSALRHP